MKTTDKEFYALMSLLQDDDPKVVSLAMEQFLKLSDLRETIAEYQEDGNTRVRKRMHQLSSILSRREARNQFIHAVQSNTPSLWQGLCKINSLYDPQASLKKINTQVRDLARQLPDDTVETRHLSAFMKKHEFMVPEEDILDGELYMMDSVLETKYGSSPSLCVLAFRLGELCGWASQTVLFEGRLCLMAEEGNLLDPAHRWNVRELDKKDKVHACSRRDVWFMVLSQLLLIALVDGQLRDLYHYGDLLTALNESSVNELPFPLGHE